MSEQFPYHMRIEYCKFNKLLPRQLCVNMEYYLKKPIDLKNAIIKTYSNKNEKI